MVYVFLLYCMYVCGMCKRGCVCVCELLCGVVWSVVCVVLSLCVVVVLMCLCVFEKLMCLSVFVCDLLCDVV